MKEGDDMTYMICVICVKAGCFTLSYQKLLYTFADWETNSHFVYKCVLLVHSSSLCVCAWRGENLFKFAFLYVNMLVDFEESHWHALQPYLFAGASSREPPEGYLKSLHSWKLRSYLQVPLHKEWAPSRSLSMEVISYFTLSVAENKRG